jgi:transposase
MSKQQKKKKSTPQNQSKTTIKEVENQPMSRTEKQSRMIKQSLGIDTSKDKLDVTFSSINESQTPRIQGTRTFFNTPNGWKLLVVWIARFRKDLSIPFSIVIEATGVYHEGVSYYLRDSNLPISVILPNNAKNYGKSLNIKSKNDKIDAWVLSRLGLERQLPIWKGLDGNLLKIRHLTREKEAVIATRTATMNQSHSHALAHQSDKLVIKRKNELIKFLDKQIKSIEDQIFEILNNDLTLKTKIDNVCTIKGVGIMTALCVIAETNGFELFENKNQVVSFSGYDIVERKSGSCLNGTTRISKKGNSHIRKSLHFPALSALKHDPNMKNIFERVVEKNPKIKMKGVVAVQRKLLVLIYTIYKSGKAYDVNYEMNKAA